MLKLAPGKGSWLEANTVKRPSAVVPRSIGADLPPRASFPVTPRASRPGRSGRSSRSSSRVVPGAADDIPLALRSHASSVRRRPPPAGLGLWLLGVVGSAALAAALLLSPLLSPLRERLTPAPSAPVAARPGLDGRLLGHFPYPEAPAADLTTLAPGLALRSDAARAFRAMQQAAAADGVDLRLLSAFRSLALQKQLFFDVKADRNQDALTRARVSAPPGFSEHSTGYAVDLGDGRLPATHLSPDFEQSPAFRWLRANANRFHFTLSFPRGNAQGVSYEPWHWRYEGSTAALRLFEPAQRFAARAAGR
jgi:D-alanyl-D-alanine carboxypeptidase